MTPYFILGVLYFLCIHGHVSQWILNHSNDNHSNLEKAFQVLQNTPLADAHNDFPEKLHDKYNGRISNLNLSRMPIEFATDIQRMRQGKLTIQIWSAFIGCKEPHPLYRTLQQIDLIKRIVSTYSNDFVFCTSSLDIEKAYKSGKMASLIGLEGAHQINSSFSGLRMMYELGVRYLTLTHTCHNDWADSCASPGIHNGLSSLGIQAIQEMNRLGMMIDLSHVSHQVMRQVLSISKAPIIFSHSSAFSLCSNPRNVPDDVLLRLKETDGIVMINFYPQFITCSSVATLKDVADHIDHIANIAGHEHVGFGSDFDGIESVPIGLEDVSKYPYLLAELLSRGWREEQIKGLCSGNFLRIFKQIEVISSTQPPLVEDYK